MFLAMINLLNHYYYNDLTDISQSLDSKLSKNEFEVNTSSNLNHLNKCGIFSVYNGINTPIPIAWCTVLVIQQNGNYNFINQLCFITNESRPYSRAYNGAINTWTAWEML